MERMNALLRNTRKQNMRTIKQFGVYRILEIEDFDYSLSDLKGDCYNPEVNSDIDPMELKRQEEEFEKRVELEGVFGYALEKWNPEVGRGWDVIDSVWGFVGQYNENSEEFNHYIVKELSEIAQKN
jgi:hypothetical protein